MALSCMLIELSLTSWALFIWGILKCLCSGWINSWGIFITWLRSSNSLSKLKWHHFPFRHFSTSSRDRLILGFTFRVLLFRVLHLFHFLILFDQLYLFISNNPFFFHIKFLSLFNKNILANFDMLFECFLIEFSITRWTLLKVWSILIHIGWNRLRFLILKLLHGCRAISLVLEMLSRRFLRFWIRPVVFFFQLFWFISIIIIWIEYFSIIVISSILSIMAILMIFTIISSWYVWSLPPIDWLILTGHSFLTSHAILASWTLSTFKPPLLKFLF